MFGMGAGLFEEENGKESPLVVTEQKNSPINRKGTSLLGDFTLYKVNKELENF